MDTNSEKFKDRKVFMNDLLLNMLQVKFIRRWMLKQAVKKIKNYFYDGSYTYKVPAKTKEDQVQLVSSAFKSINRHYERGLVSMEYLSKYVKALAHAANNAPAQFDAFQKKYGTKPPGLLILSPTQACNLKCEGCYADCDDKNKNVMPYDMVTRILKEKEESWGAYFTVVSGGEPFMYKDKETGKTIYDVFESFPNHFFMVYTNGTLIDEKAAKKLAKLGNVMLCISVEGYEEETDERRGKGIHAKALKAMENLRNVGVIYGLSFTVTAKNADLLIDDFDSFLDFYAEKHGIGFMWLFQYVPVGRDYDAFSLVVPPEKRRKLFDVTWEQVYKRDFFIADFWNSGHITAGCLSAGRDDGFVYIDWDGNVMPCVFNPWYVDNMHDVYANDGHLDDVLFSDFMKGIRQWQDNNRYDPVDPEQNFDYLTCCPIKDHFADTYELACSCGVKSCNKEAETAFHDTAYHEKMIQYGKDCQKEFAPLWENEHIASDNKKKRKKVS